MPVYLRDYESYVRDSSSNVGSQRGVAQLMSHVIAVTLQLTQVYRYTYAISLYLCYIFIYRGISRLLYVTMRPMDYRYTYALHTSHTCHYIAA